MANARYGAARWVDIPPERFPGWLGSFAGRHGPGRAVPTDHGLTLFGRDGAASECQVPFPPVDWRAIPAGQPTAAGGQPPAAGCDIDALAGIVTAHCLAPRTVGVILVRLGGYGAAVFTGPEPVLAASKVGARLVHGRSSAGGSSQQRFARRREKQAREALRAAADTAAAVLRPYSGRLDAVVLGGDRRAIAGLRDDPRLREFFALSVDRFLTVPDPRLSVLRAAPRMFRAVRVRLTEPASQR
jgi:hypothetical protein